jgi:tetratricopeptide (TPR) repeat protein
LLLAIADAPEHQVRAELNRLQAAEFLYELRLFPDLEYTFKHALTHEVAYQGVLQDRRRALHVRIVEAIEALYPDRRTEQIERLADHALRGGVWAKAVAYLRQAGAKAAGRSAHREAIVFFEQALGALHHLPESREKIEQAIDLRFDLRSSLYPLAELGRILDLLHESETMAEALDDQRRLGKVADYMAHYFWWTGEPDRAIEAGGRALAIAAALGDFCLQAAATFYQGRAYLTLGDFGRARDLLRSNVKFLQGSLLFDRCGMSVPPSLASRVYLVWCLAELGECAEAYPLAAEAVRLAEALEAWSLPISAWGICT